MPDDRRPTRPQRPSWALRVLAPPSLDRDRLPSSTPWQGVVAARVLTYLAWAAAMWIVLRAWGGR
jgi:hypothetical protein